VCLLGRQHKALRAVRFVTRKLFAHVAIQKWVFLSLQNTLSAKNFGIYVSPYRPCWSSGSKICHSKVICTCYDPEIGTFSTGFSDTFPNSFSYRQVATTITRHHYYHFPILSLEHLNISLDCPPSPRLLKNRYFFHSKVLLKILEYKYISTVL
jgi:hypothetical protein